MLEKIFGLFRSKETPPPPLEEKLPRIKSYMFVFEAQRNMKLAMNDIPIDLEGYKRGDRDVEFQRRSQRASKKLFMWLDVLRDSKEEVIDYVSNNYKGPIFNCAILELNCSRDEAYNLIAEGRFHEAIEGALNYHEAVRDYRTERSTERNVPN